MGSRLKIPLPHTRSLDAASTINRSPVASSFLFNLEFCPNFAIFPAKTTELFTWSYLASEKLAVSFPSRFCSFGEEVASTLFCISESLKRPAFMSNMNCSAQLNVIVPSVSVSSTLSPINVAIWALLTVNVEGNHWQNSP